MKSNEILRSIEHSTVGSAGHQASSDVLAPAQVEAVFTRRVGMLGSVERYITVKLRQVLREKIEFEKKLLLDIVAAQDRTQAVAKKAVHVLSKAFFERQPLDNSLFE